MKKLVFIGGVVVSLFACKKDTLIGTVQGSYTGRLINYNGINYDTTENYTIEITENEEGLVYNGYTVYPTTSTKDLWYYTKESGDNILIDITYFVESERIYVGTQTTGSAISIISTFSGAKQ